MLPVELQGHILIAGAGVSGLGCAKLLHQLGANITVADDNPANLAALPHGVATVTVAGALAAIDRWGIVVTSPGWRPDSELLVAAQKADKEVIGDVELAYRLDRAGVFGSPRQWLVVTGTNGKTTTTGMLAAIMAADEKHSGKKAQAVGNIGVSVFDALAASRRVDILVAELSSFQLHWSRDLRPDVGVLLNLADDHLDWHGSFNDYALSKAKVLNGVFAVIGQDDQQVLKYTAHARGDRPVIGFTAGIPATNQVGVEAGKLVSRIGGSTTVLTEVSGIEPAGVSGVLDAAAAASAALLAGAQPESVAQGLSNYRVAGHRGAKVHTLGGVDFVDNSKATNPHAADAALSGLENVIWIAGGQLKGAAVEQLIKDHHQQIKAAVLLGCDRAILAQALAHYAPEIPVDIIDSTAPDDAMEQALKAAWAHAQPGDTVLLAPAAASLDMYPSMAVRGDIFASKAQSLETAAQP